MLKITSEDRKKFYRNSRIYKLMSSPKRLEILNVLAKEEVNVSDLVKITGMRKSNVSQHLTLLKDLKLVFIRKQGKHSYYKISDPSLVKPCQILNKLWDKNHFNY